MKFKSLAKILLISIFSILAFVAIGLFIWAEVNSSPPTPSALEALISDDHVTVTDGRWLVFEPNRITPQIGLIFYPGGLVEPGAYAPVLKQIAAHGILVVVTPMPLNLAIINTNAANAVIKVYPNIKTWALAGHSLGGATAATFVENNPGVIDILALWAANPSRRTDLSNYSLLVISIYGSEDNLVPVRRIEARKHLLPEDTIFYEIEGGNHEQFGDYGHQEGDGVPGISIQEQHALIVDHMLAILAP